MLRRRAATPPGRERRRDLPREHEQGEVPRDDLPGDADRPRRAVGKGVLELVGPARVVEEVRRRERQVDVARLADGLAAVQRLDDRELARALLEDARDPEEVLRALARTELRPPLGVRLARGLHRAIDIGLPRLRDLGERLLACRIDGRVALVRERLEELAADVEPVAILEVHDLARLGSGRVLPRGRYRRGLAAARDLAP